MDRPHAAPLSGAKIRLQRSWKRSSTQDARDQRRQQVVEPIHDSGSSGCGGRGNDGTAARGRHRIRATGRPRVAAAEPAQPEPDPAQHTMRGDRFVGVGRARGVVAARARGPGRDHPLVDHDQGQERRPDNPATRPGAGAAARLPGGVSGPVLAADAAGWTAASTPGSLIAGSRQQALEDAVEVGAELGRVGRRGGRLGPQDQQRAGLQASDAGAHLVAEPTAHAVAYDGVAHGLGHDQADPSRLGRGGCASSVQVGDQRRTARPATGTDRATEVVAAGHAVRGGQHRAGSTEGVRPVRPRARRGPCGDGHRGSTGRPGSASAAGSHGSWLADGCSAGRCACSLGTPDFGDWLWGKLTWGRACWTSRGKVEPGVRRLPPDARARDATRACDTSRRPRPTFHGTAGPRSRSNREPRRAGCTTNRPS